MLKILGGKFRGRIIKAPSGLVTRPTSARVREALFSILGDSIFESRVVDLFAGSGAIGLEALSRGAKWCLFVESNSLALGSLVKNIKMLRLNIYVKVLKINILSDFFRISKFGPFNFIFADPPYDLGLVQLVVKTGEWLVNNGILVINHSIREQPFFTVPNLCLIDRRVYGRSVLSFIQFSFSMSKRLLL